MHQKEFEHLVQETLQSTTKLLVIKGGEYAGSEDRLANFKRGATLTGCTPMQCAFVYMSKHYDSLATFIRDDATRTSRPRSESMEGRLDDLINYCLLMKGLMRENEQQTKSRAVAGQMGEPAALPAHSYDYRVEAGNSITGSRL